MTAQKKPTEMANAIIEFEVKNLDELTEAVKKATDLAEQLNKQLELIKGFNLEIASKPQ